VFVIGEVQHPGVFQVLGSRSLLDLLSMAGGLTMWQIRESPSNGGVDRNRR